MTHQRYGNADPAGLFAVACPGCATEIGVRASRMGSAARCPVCRGLFLVPEPRLPPADPIATPTATPAATAATVPAAEPAAAAVAAPAVDEPLPALAPPPPPPGAAPAPVATPFDDLEVPAITGSPELALAEPARTVAVGDRVIELRRVPEEERRRRKARRTIVILLVGSGFLAGLAWVLGRLG